MQAPALNVTPAIPAAAPAATPVSHDPNVQFFATPVAKSADADQVMYKVRDLLATDPAHCPRVHEVLDAKGQIVKYSFKNADTYIKMPMNMATKFIGNEGFQVLNERGHEMRAQRIETDENRGVILAYDQTVARYEELTHDALLTRANIAGGTFKKNSSKDEMISYLIEASLQNKSASIADSGDALDVEEEEEFA